MTRITTKEKYKIVKLLETQSIDFVSIRYHISVRTLYRWKAKFDGTPESLNNKSTKPHTRHPNAHTDTEIRNIAFLIRRNPNIGLNELYGKLRLNYGYSRNPVSLYRYLKRNGYYTNKSIRKPYSPKPYDTPINIGEKMQLDVKYVLLSAAPRVAITPKDIINIRLLTKPHVNVLYMHIESATVVPPLILSRALVNFLATFRK